MRLLAFSAMVLLVLVPNATPQTMKKSNKWVQKWTKIDQSAVKSIDAAARIFKVDPNLMKEIVSKEGGFSHSPRTLSMSLVDPYKMGNRGWNGWGSYAFGPFQFMMASKPAPSPVNWGTFGSYDDAAFQDAKRRGTPVPYRFKTPASNVGQAITAAYMLANGGLHHWCASMC